jgi:hypothetical protein
MVQTMMIREPEKKPNKIASRLVEDLTDGADRPIPDVVTVDGTRVAIADLRDVISAFRYQKNALQQGGFDSWPCAELKERSEGTSFWVPIDMRTDRFPRGSVSEILSGVAVHEAANTAGRAGLSTEFRPLRNAWQAFTDTLGEMIAGRRTTVIDPDDGAPEEPFEVTTDSRGLEVLFSIGPFLSTRTGFGRSTPARRRLPWGSYCFGVKVNGQARFDDTIWKVPENTTVHIPA